MGLARVEAQRLNHDRIETGHVLLGLLSQEAEMGARALNAVGVTLKPARAAFEEVSPPGDRPVTMEQLPFTPTARTLLEHTLDEAARMGHRFVDTGHLTLALLRDEQGSAGRTLGRVGIDAEQEGILRQWITEEYRAAGDPPGAPISARDLARMAPLVRSHPGWPALVWVLIGVAIGFVLARFSPWP